MSEKIVNANSERGQLAGEVIIEVIENQLAQDNPKETRLTLARLIAMGESRENAMRVSAKPTTHEQA